MKITVVIPAFNEEKTIKKILEEVKNCGADIIVVNDGSSDKTGEIAENEGVTVINHIINRGLGAALGTGIEAALLSGADYIVTFDADGQHQAEDIFRLKKIAEEGGYDIVIGSRLLNPRGMPLARRVANWLGNLSTYLLFGIWVTDSQSGLRLFTAPAASLLHLKSNRMEVSSEIIKEVKRHNFKFTEIPIEAVYTDYSLSKGQNFVVGLKTLWQLILQKISK
ncbi:MAG: glycosyltransferase family 2 protein [Patescibacteria group bacterium]|nr:glycosyltransferase family 2 protein [Patescibacteria group bacterium]MDD5490733.1 glycosyltransferase family 2 protein [Patescibacteria group bacterium]